jgi:hypothetical protein
MDTVVSTWKSNYARIMPKSEIWIYAIDFPTVQFCINIAPLGNEHLFCVLVCMNWLRVGFWVLGQYL